MKKYKELLSELPSKTIVVTFGQFNPPSVGHELLIKVVRKLASQRKADHNVFVSSVQDKKNPLEISKKIQYLETLFPNTKFTQRETNSAVSSLSKYKRVIVVASGEAMNDYKKLFKKNNINAEFVQAGTKCPDSDDRLLKLASKGEYQSFKSALPTTARELDGKRLMNDIRIGLDLDPIKEQINLVKDELREQYFRGEIFNEGDIVESDSEVYKIIKRGSNHLLLQTEEGLKVSKWIQDVQLTEREFMLDEKQLQEADATSATGVAQKEAEKAKADTAAAQQKLKFTSEKEALAKKQEREAAALKNMQTEAIDSPVVNKNSKYNIAKSVMSLSDFRKSMAQSKPEGDAEEKEIACKVEDGLVGNAHMGDSHGLRHQKVKHHLGEGNGYDDNRTGFAKKPREDDEYHNEPKPKFKAKSLMDRPHTVHIDGKPWKKFDNGHQAHAAAKTLQAKGKKANAIAHFREESELDEARMSAAVKLQRAFEREQAKSAASRQRAKELLNPKKEEPKTPVKEETEEQQGSRKAQLKRFKAQATDAKLGCDIKEAAYAGLEKESKPGKIKTAVVKTHPKAVESETVEGWEDEKKPVKEEFDDINEDELMSQVEADLDALVEEDFYEAYDDDELAIIDEDTGEEIEAVAEEAQLDTPALMEVLSRQERIKARARMRRTQTKRERREKVALRQFSTPQVANKRARRMAVSALKKRLLRGQNPNHVSVGQKERIERFIAQRKKIVDRLSARMVSRVKQVEKARMSHKKFTKPNNGVQF